MSRSRRKTPVAGIAGTSDKADKQKASRKLRRIVKERLTTGRYDSLPRKREASDVWGFSKDGKMRFDPGRWPRLMRK